MIILLVLIIIAILIEAFFSSSEMALISCDTANLKKLVKKNHISARVALKLLENRERFLVLTLLVVNVCTVLNANLMASLFQNHTNVANPYLWAILCSSVSIAIFGELIPKSFAQRYSLGWTLIVAHPIWLVEKLLYVFLSIVSGYANTLKRLFGGDSNALMVHKFTPEDLQGVIRDTKSHQTDLLLDEIEIINNILDISDVKASDIMTPLVNMKALNENTLIRDCIIEYDQTEQYSKLPIFRNRVDNIIGFVRPQDLIRSENFDDPVKVIMRKSQYVSEFSSLKQLFSTFKETSSEIVFVVNEYGGVVGLLTLEDILEEIIGEINDEYDKDDLKTKIRPRAGGYVVPAVVNFYEFIEHIGLTDFDEDFVAESLGGVIIEQLGKIPSVGEKIFLGDKMECEIMEVSAKKIEVVYVKLLEII
jgi:CBS domain containing-hemolysin-like protein